jgi:hypothetical protein
MFQVGVIERAKAKQQEEAGVFLFLFIYLFSVGLRFELRVLGL